MRGGSGSVLPASLGPMTLRNTVDGAEAAAMVDRMHGHPVAEARNAIGFYASARGGAVLYLTVYPEEAAARDAELRMGRKIATGEYPFQSYREAVVDGKRVAACVGLGQAHFILSHRSLLYWLAVHPPLAEAALRDLLASLP